MERKCDANSCGIGNLDEKDNKGTEIAVSKDGPTKKKESDSIVPDHSKGSVFVFGRTRGFEFCASPFARLGSNYEFP